MRFNISLPEPLHPNVEKASSCQGLLKKGLDYNAVAAEAAKSYNPEAESALNAGACLIKSRVP